MIIHHLDVAEGWQHPYATLAQTIASIIREHIPGELPSGELPIRLNMTSDDECAPVVYFRGDHYAVNLTCKPGFYCQFAYQLSHELGHVLFGPGRTNSLIETFAVAVSLLVMSKLALAGAQVPGNGWGGDYAASFQAYREGRLAKALEKVPEALASAFREGNWELVAHHFGKLRLQDDLRDEDRDLQVVAAETLMKSHHFHWEDLSGVSRQTLPEVTDGNKALLNIEHLPNGLRQALSAIGVH